jgi:glycosyltransferase involved in cell wall biosynthesis
MKITMNNKRLKVAVLIRNYNKSGGGAERYCVELTERLAKIYEVHVFSQNITEKSDSITFNKISQYFNRPRYLNQLLFSWLTKRATQNKFDIVHSHDMATYANIYTLHVPCVRTKWTHSKGIKKILRWANTLLSPRKMAYLWLENKEMQVLPNRHFISVSEYLSRNIIESYPNLNGHITIAHPGINNSKNTLSDIPLNSNSLKKELRLGSDDFLFLFVGNDLVKKGLPSIIEALKVLGNHHIHLAIAGNGKKNMIMAPAELEVNIHFLGIVDNMIDLYQKADCLIHPTLVDTYGMVVLEAMSAKLPVIVSNKNYCGFTEHLNDEQALILENPKDAIELSKMINLMFTDADLRKKITINGFEKTQSISWENTLEKTLLAYNIVLKNKRNNHEG